MIKRVIALAGAVVMLAVPWSGALAQGTVQKPILAGPFAKLNIKDAEVEPNRGKPLGTLTIAQHFALDPRLAQSTRTFVCRHPAALRLSRARRAVQADAAE